MDNSSTIFGNNLSTQEITRIIVEGTKNSKQIKEMISADNYFDGKNEVIAEKTRCYYDKDRNKYDNPYANNARVNSNFCRMLIEQKQDYGFAKSFIFKLSDENEEEIDLSENDYGKEWKKFLDDKLFEFAHPFAGQAISRGLAWAYVWIDENAELQIKDVPATLIFPVWNDAQHHELDRLVYDYEVQKYNSTEPTVEEYAEYWSSTERILYNVTNDYKEIPIQIVDDDIVIHSHMMNEKGEEFNWDRIPFISLKGTSDEKTLLSFIKEQIDSYDKLDSSTVDNLIDELDPLLILKGMSSDIEDIIEGRQLVKMTRTMSMDADGDAKFIQANIDIDSRLKEKESLRRDIIKFGYGVDFEDSRFGGNPNQMVIKSLYQNMSTYTDGLERRFQDFMNNLKYFFDKWYEFTNKGSFEDAQKYRILVKLDRSMMFNKSEQIQDVKILGETGVSRKTQLENNPYVQDVDVELERIKEEEKEVEQKQKKMMEDMYQFNKESEDDESEDKDDKIKNNKIRGDKK